MKKIVIAMLIAGLAAAPALALASEPVSSVPGHWAWISDPIIGPKSSPATRHHVWIPDHPVAIAGEGAGHWQWVSELSVGPRGGAPIRHRIWVSDQ